MFIYFLFFNLILMITLILLFINYLTSSKYFFSIEKKTPYECGFEPISPPHLPFSISFFMIMFIFLIFDIEICMILPMIFNLSYWNNLTILLVIFIFIILTLGLIIEWMMKNIEWLK